MKFAIKLLLAYTLLTPNLYSASVILGFQPKVDSTAHELGEVLHIENDTHHWAQLPLQSHPNPGQWITKDMIINWLQQKTGTFESKWQGKTRIQVQQTIQTSSNELLTEAQEALKADLAAKYKRVELTALTQPKDSEYALDEFEFAIKNTYPTTKRVCVWLNHGKKHIPIWFEVHAYDLILEAKDNLSANTRITARDFTLKERNIAGLKGQPVTRLAKDAWLKSHVEKGTILLTNQVTKAPLVTQGQSVQVRINHHNISIVMDGIALTDGRLGQAISIKNPSNQQRFTAQVTGPQQAEVRS